MAIWSTIIMGIKNEIQGRKNLIIADSTPLYLALQVRCQGCFYLSLIENQ